MLAKVRPWRIPYSRRGMHEFCGYAKSLQEAEGFKIRSSIKNLEGRNGVFVALPVVGDGRSYFSKRRSGVTCTCSRGY